MKLNKSIADQWFKKIIDPSNNCYNLRAFVYNIFGVTLYSNQWKTLRAMLDPKMRKVYISFARQAGKTYLLGIFQALVAIFPNQIVPHNNGRINCFVFAPKLEQAQKGFDDFSYFVHYNPGNIFDGTIVMDKADRIKFNNNVLIRAITASRNAEIEGLSANIIILEESQAISPYKARSSIFPMGGGVEGGAKIIQIGVPDKTGTHFHKAYKNPYNHKTAPNGYHQFIYPWQKCPRLSKTYVTGLRDEDPISFSRNYDLRWDSQTIGMFISEEQYESCHSKLAWKDINKILADPTFPLFMGIDFAKLRDETVITIGYVDDKTGDLEVIYWWALPGVDYATQVGFIKDLCSQHNIKYILVDKSSIGEPMIDFMKQAGLSVEGKNFDQVTKDKLYKFFRSRISQRKVKWPRLESIQKEDGVPLSFIKMLKKFESQMLELEIDYKPNGLIAVSANPKDNTAHDDYPTSACLLTWISSNHIEPTAYFA